MLSPDLRESAWSGATAYSILGSLNSLSGTVECRRRGRGRSRRWTSGIPNAGTAATVCRQSALLRGCARPDGLPHRFPLAGKLSGCHTGVRLSGLSRSSVRATSQISFACGALNRPIQTAGSSCILRLMSRRCRHVRICARATGIVLDNRPRLDLSRFNPGLGRLLAGRSGARRIDPHPGRRRDGGSRRSKSDSTGDRQSDRRERRLHHGVDGTQNRKHEARRHPHRRERTFAHVSFPGSGLLYLRKTP